MRPPVSSPPRRRPEARSLAAPRALAVVALATGRLLAPRVSGARRSARVAPTAVPGADSARGDSLAGRLGPLVATPAVGPGARVRVWRDPVFFSEGRVLETRGDTLVVVTAIAGATRRVPLDGVKRLDLRVGRVPRVQGAVLGGAIGIAASFVMSAAVVHALGGSLAEGTRTTLQLTRVALPYGVVGGAVAGALLPGDRWRRVRLQSDGRSTDGPFRTTMCSPRRPLPGGAAPSFPDRPCLPAKAPRRERPMRD